MTFRGQGRLEEANALSLRAIKILERLGPDDPNFVNSLHNRSELFVAQARVGVCNVITFIAGVLEKYSHRCSQELFQACYRHDPEAALNYSSRSYLLTI